MDQGEQLFPSKNTMVLSKRGRMLAVTFILFGDLFYFPWVSLLFIGYLLLGQLSALSIVPIASVITLFFSAVMMFAKPKLHTAWGTLVVAMTLLAVLTDGSLLANALMGADLYAQGFWIVPLVLLLFGGSLAIIWKPATTPSAAR